MLTQHLRNYTLAQVENLYRAGTITQDQWEGFFHAWQTSTPRFGYGAAYARHEFATPEAEAVALELGCCTYTYDSKTGG